VELAPAAGYMPDIDTCPVAAQAPGSSFPAVAACRFADMDPISAADWVAGKYRGQALVVALFVEMTNPGGHRIRHNISLRTQSVLRNWRNYISAPLFYPL
jgi:hypothetical protein